MQYFKLCPNTTGVGEEVKILTFLNDGITNLEKKFNCKLVERMCTSYRHRKPVPKRVSNSIFHDMQYVNTLRLLAEDIKVYLSGY